MESRVIPYDAVRRKDEQYTQPTVVGTCCRTKSSFMGDSPSPRLAKILSTSICRLVRSSGGTMTSDSAWLQPRWLHRNENP